MTIFKLRILRHILIFFLLLLAAVILRRSIPPQPQLTQVLPQQQVQGESAQGNNYFDINYGDRLIRARWFEVNDISNIELIPNYEDFMTSVDIIESYQCKRLVNGGFYNIDNTPLGLVIANGKQLTGFRRNNLMNGILSINDFNTPRITRNMPSGNVEDALQTGPVLWENGGPLLLDLSTDKNARRVVAAVTGDNKLYFIVFYEPESAFNGPLLVNLPGLIDEVDNHLKLNVADAVNLDGGAASVFINEEVSLSELSSVGSFWCVK